MLDNLKQYFEEEMTLRKEVSKVVTTALQRGLNLRDVQRVLIQTAFHHCRYHTDDPKAFLSQAEMAANPMSIEERAARFSTLFNQWADEERIDFQIVSMQHARA